MKFIKSIERGRKMKRICLGTMITLLYQSRVRSTDKIKTVCGGIFAAFGLDIDNFNKELPSHLKSGYDPVPSILMDAARNLSMDDIDKGFEEYVLPLIHNGNTKHFSVQSRMSCVMIQRF